ncbi:MAG: zinc ribbon domain-containing protein, partial [Halobacteria archaeon]|nr:zinc ribbon domain-containing protein [Halobacteria archaeon]
TTPPMAEEDVCVRLGEFLGLPRGATHHTFTGSTRAGTRALISAVESPAENALVTASDAPRGETDSREEHAAGAGATSFVLTQDGSLRISDYAEYNSEYPGTRFRPTGSSETESLDITQYERTAFIETLGRATDELDFDEERVDCAAVQAPDANLPYRAASRLNVSRDKIDMCILAHETGDTGAASVPLSVAEAFNQGVQTALVASFGSGAGADSMVLELEASGEIEVSFYKPQTKDLSYAEYLRQRGEITTGSPSGGGAYVSVPSWRRTLPQRYRLEAGECPECGALNFPPEGACAVCHEIVEYDTVKLSKKGEVEAITVISQGGAPPEFAEYQSRTGDFGVAVVSFGISGQNASERGKTASVPAQVTDGERNLEVGDEVEATIRRIYTQEDVTRYGFKVQSADK